MSTDYNHINKKFMVEGFDFSGIDFMQLLCGFDQGVLMTDDQGILVFYNDVQATIDKLDPADVMWPGVIVTGIVGAPLSLFPDSGRAVVDSLFGMLTHNFK
ncbi:MAG: hypothetical protein V1793_00910 [Pseudomonadota bacterium]